MKADRPYGEYSDFHLGLPDGSTRSRTSTDAEERYEFETVVPATYEIS